MAIQKPRAEYLKKILAVFKSCKGNHTLAAKKTGVPYSTFRRYLSWAKEGTAGENFTKKKCLSEFRELLRKHGDLSQTGYQKLVVHPGIWVRWWPSWNDFKIETKKGAEMPPPLSTRDQQRYVDKIQSLSLELRNATRELNDAEDFRKALFNLTAQDLSPPDFKIGISRKGIKDVPSVPFLLVSDEQAGEVIRAKEIEGINEYNSEIYRQRHRKTFEITADISKHHMRVMEPGIVVGWLGDGVSGSIHAELRETNDPNDGKDIPAVRMVVEEREAAIRALLGQYRAVFAVILPGNHGRLTEKPRYKRYADTNLETVIGWWLQSIFRDEKRVKIVVPPSGDYFMPLWGWNTFFTHGDRLGTGGGQGFIGPAAPIIRGSKKVFEQQARIGRNIHYLNFGHWHTRMETGYGFANGCMCGFGEFSYGLRYAPAAAEQWLYYLHPEKGATARWPIYLTDQPKGFSADDAIEWFKTAA